MTALQRRGLAAGIGSAALLAAALAWQHLGGVAPCPLCIWQRWPHLLAAALGLALLAAPRRATAAIAALGAAAMLVGAGLAAYHVGIEQGWWAGPATCVAPAVAGLTPAELLERILETPVVRCDEIAWSLLGVSMAGWNALGSLALAALWALAVRAGYASSSASQ